MDIIALLTWLESLPLSEYVRSSPWAYPILETVHMFGLGLVFGGIFLFDLRLLGVHPGLPIDKLARHILPWVWTGFALNLTSGVALFLSDAVTFGLNRAFQVKLVLLGITGMLVVWFQYAHYPRLQKLDGEAGAPASVKVLAVTSIALWLAIITAGRMIAYVPEPDIGENEPASQSTSGTTHNPAVTRNTGQAKWRAPVVTKI